MMLNFSSVGRGLVVCLICGLGARADEAVQVSQLPGQYSQFVWGGAGRYVALHFAPARKVIVYDLSGGPKVLLEIPEVPQGDLLAAGADKLVIVSPGKMMIRRWDFQSKKRDKLAIIEGNDPPQLAVMGSAGQGPLLIVGSRESRLYDLDTLRAIAVKGKMISGTGRHGLSVQASPGGRTFGTIPTGYGPVGYGGWHIEGDDLSLVSFGGTSNAVRWAQPTGDGYLFLLPEGEIYNQNGRAIKADWLKGSTLIPTPDPRYILDVRLDQKLPANKTLGKVTVCSTADCRPIDFEMGFEELLPARINSGHDIKAALRLGSQWRVQYVPSLNQLITLPATNDRLMLRPFDLKKRLKNSERSYLYVSSIPPLAVQAGATLEYRIDVESRGKQVRIRLEDGPKDARLAKKNLLKWKVPADTPEPWARFLLSITNGDGEEMFHSFEVAVRRPTDANR